MAACRYNPLTASWRSLAGGDSRTGKSKETNVKNVYMRCNVIWLRWHTISLHRIGDGELEAIPEPVSQRKGV